VIAPSVSDEPVPQGKDESGLSLPVYAASDNPMFTTSLVALPQALGSEQF
jgi:hypothetical protein